MLIKNKFIHKLISKIYNIFIIKFNIYKIIALYFFVILNITNLIFYVNFVFGYYIYYLVFAYTGILDASIVFLICFIFDNFNIFCYRFTGSLGDIFHYLILKTYGLIFLPIFLYIFIKLIYSPQIVPKMKLLLQNKNEIKYQNYQEKLIELCKEFSLNIKFKSFTNYRNYTAYYFKCIEKDELTVLPLRFKILESDFEYKIFQSNIGKVRHIFDYDQCIIEVHQNNVTYFSEILYQPNKYLFYNNGPILIDNKQHLVVNGEILRSLLFSLVLTSPNSLIYLYNYSINSELSLFNVKYILCLQEVVQEIEYRYYSIIPFASSLDEYRLLSLTIAEYREFENIYLYINQEKSALLDYILMEGKRLGVFVILCNCDSDDISIKIQCISSSDAILKKEDYSIKISIPIFQKEEMLSILKNNN